MKKDFVLSKFQISNIPSGAACRPPAALVKMPCVMFSHWADSSNTAQKVLRGSNVSMQFKRCVWLRWVSLGGDFKGEEVGREERERKSALGPSSFFSKGPRLWLDVRGRQFLASVYKLREYKKKSTETEKCNLAGYIPQFLRPWRKW